MKASQLKNKYLDFFKKKGHIIIPSASLVPANDASVLFNTAGMQPLVPYFSGQKHPAGKRLVNIQKCLRTVDFENIGDNSHHTFFQMLGNWSLGDYFKEEAIKWSFEFLTGKNWLNLSLKNLAVTVYKGDEQIPKDKETYNIWKELGFSKSRIAYVGKDNFWIAGDTGPCGPSSEMFYWTGEGEAPKTFDPENECWMEIWNDVFMVYNKDEKGNLTPLKQKNVDTGMGFERTLAVLSGEKSAYETDLFSSIIKKIELLSGKNYDIHKKEMRIIADHLRAAVFILGDENAVVPSNLDRGYILRRLIRRAVRYSKVLGINKIFTDKVGGVIIKTYTKDYPELSKNEPLILLELKKEEEKFENTLEKGLNKFAKMSSSKKITGEDAFLLFQSYGFPVEMTQELADEKGVKVDLKSFEKEYQKHQELSRIGAEKKFKGGLGDASEETKKLHTATHLLNEALNRVLGGNIRQRGSNITSERLRFDFNFDRKLTAEELKAVEDEVNKVIQDKMEVQRKEMLLKDALKSGAHGEFGTKYPEKVSVYTVGDYSNEICMGPHVDNTVELGRFKIVKEQSSSAGIRRIKAVLEKWA